MAFIVLRPFDALKVNSLFTGPSVLGIDHRSPLTSSVKRKGESFVDIGTGPTPIFTSGESRFSARRWKIAREKQSRRFNLFTLRLWRGELWTTFRSSKEVSLFFRYSYLAHLERRNEKILILPL